MKLVSCCFRQTIDKKKPQPRAKLLERILGSGPTKTSLRYPAARAQKAEKEEKEEIVQLHKSAQFQAFNEYLANASDILSRYEKYVNRNPAVQTNERCAELEVVNKDLQHKCQYLSQKVKSLESIIANQVTPAVHEEEVPQIESSAIDEIEIPNEHAIGVSEPNEIKSTLKTTFTCDYCSRTFARKFNLRTHILVCKAKLFWEPKNTKKKVIPCKICKKKYVSRRKLSIHLWSMIRDWECRTPRGAHSKLSLDQHKAYRKSLLK